MNTNVDLETILADQKFWKYLEGKFGGLYTDHPEFKSCRRYLDKLTRAYVLSDSTKEVAARLELSPNRVRQMRYILGRKSRWNHAHGNPLGFDEKVFDYTGKFQGSRDFVRMWLQSVYQNHPQKVLDK